MTPSPSQHHPKAGKIIGVVVAGLAGLWLVASMLGFGIAMLHHAITPDYPWLLAGGRWILENKALPSTDLFSWTLPEKPWTLYQWGFELVLASLHPVLGTAGLTKAFIVLMLGLYVGLPWVWHRHQQVPTLWSILLIGLGLLIVTINLSLRPMAITAMALALQYVGVSGFRQGRLRFNTLALGLALLYWLWGNLHPGVTLGLLSLALWGLGDAWARRNPTLSNEAPQPWACYLALIGIGFAASLLNPYGLGLYAYLWNLSLQTYMNNTIMELRAPDFHTGQFTLYLLMTLIGAGLMLNRRTAYSPPALLHWTVFTVMTLFVQRFVVWSVLLNVLILPQALAQWSRERQTTSPTLQYILATAQKGTLLLSCLALMLPLLLLVPGSRLNRPQLGICQPLMPGIKAYARKRLPTDRLLNDPETGSCTLLLPKPYPVFIDTRFDFYGTQHMRTQRETMHLAGNWQRVLKHWRINTVMMAQDKPLIRLLRQQPEYTVLYEDAAICIVRRRPAS